MKDGDKVLVQLTVKNSDEYEWAPGVVTGSCESPDPNENFRRINVLLDDGRLFLECHPDCVRISNEKPEGQLKML